MLENTKYLEDAHLMVDIEFNERKIDDEERRSLHDFLEYKFKKHISLSITRLLENRIFFESVEGEFLFDYNEHREYTTIEGYLNSYTDRLFSFAEDFCLINKIRLDVREKLLKVAKVHYILTVIIISNCHKRLVEDSNYVEIVDSFKSQYEEELKVKPREKGFRYYLEGVFEIHNLHLDEVIMRHLAEYVVSEKQKNINFIQQAKDKQQTLINITPHQTLSIETTSATVEEGKKDEIIDFVKDINPCIEFDDLFRGNVKGKIEIWNYMILLKMIDQDGNYIPIGKTAIIRAFVVLMRKHFKLPIAKSPEEMIRIFGLKLSIKGVVRVRPKPEIDLKEQELVKLLNASETKTLTFSYIA